MAEAAAVVATANHEVGVVERPTNRTKYGAWYGLDGQPWCAMFVTWCLDQAGGAKLVTASPAKGFLYCRLPGPVGLRARPCTHALRRPG